MIMRAKQDGNVIVFELEGHLDYETTVKFQETCASLIKRNESQRIVLDMEKLKFVGSSGINQFIKVLKEFNHFSTKPRFCKVSSEFTKIFRAYQTSRRPFEFFDTVPKAIEAFDTIPAPKTIAKKKKIETPLDV